MTRRFTTADLEALTEGATPGPWELSDSEWEPHDVRNEAQDLWIATTGDGDDGVDEERLADARLIAAAPELAAELHRIQTALEDRIQTLRIPLCSHMPEGDELDEYAEQWARQQYEISVLARILNGDTNE